MKLAYFLLAHKNADQVAGLLDVLADGQNYVVIHADKKSTLSFRQELAQIVGRYPQVRVISEYRCVWGGWSLVQAELSGIRELLGMGTDWQFFFNLSGQDLPLKSQISIRDSLAPFSGRNFVDMYDMQKQWPRALKRVRRYYLEIPNPWIQRPIPTYIPRHFMKGVTPFAGSQWHTLTRSFCDYLVHSPEVKRFRRFYRLTSVPDEMFFQTVLMHSPFRETLDVDNRRFVPLFPGKNSPRVLDMSDLGGMLESPCWFARKFDPAVDPEVIQRLLAHAKG